MSKERSQQPDRLTPAEQGTFKRIDTVLAHELAMPLREYIPPKDKKAPPPLQQADIDGLNEQLARARPREGVSPEVRTWQTMQRSRRQRLRTHESRDLRSLLLWVGVSVGVVATGAVVVAASTHNSQPAAQNTEALRATLASDERLRHLGACAPILQVVGDLAQQAKDKQYSWAAKRPQPADYYTAATRIEVADIPCVPATAHPRASVMANGMSVTVSRTSLFSNSSLDYICAKPSQEWLRRYAADLPVNSPAAGNAQTLLHAVREQC